MMVLRMKDRRLGEVVRDNKGKRVFNNLRKKNRNHQLPSFLLSVRERAYSTPVITSLLLSKTKPCIIVFLVSGANMTPPPLIPDPSCPTPPPFALLVLAVGAAVELNNNPLNTPGKLPVKVGYKCAT